MRASTTTETDDDEPVGHRRRRLKRSSASLPLRRSPASHPSRGWVLLNRAGARQDDFRRDRTTFAMSRTSRGEEISVAFVLVEPPGTSVLTVDWPPPASSTTKTTTPRTNSTGNVLAAHRDVVLLAITSSYENTTYPHNDTRVVDLFVYQVSASLDDPSRRRRPTPLLLPLPSAGGPAIYDHLVASGEQEIGIMSSTSTDDDDDEDSPSFVVAELQMWRGKGARNDVRLFRSGSSGQWEWESFKNLHVSAADGDRDDLRWWSTDAVVPYGRRSTMIWVDYYRGMLLMDLSSSLPSSEMTTTNPPPPPRLRYVPLPVDRIEDPEDNECRSRGCPKASRSVCVTRHGIKFVSVDTKHWSNFGVGSRQQVLKWSQRFRITTWWLREDDDGGDYSWRRDATMHEDEFWDAFDGGHRFPFPHVVPRFPVVDVDNPDVVVFQLEKPGYCYDDEQKWMIEVDLRKKVLLAAICYSRETGDAETINSARMKSCFEDSIPSELPRYLDAGQACKKRRQ